MFCDKATKDFLSRALTYSVSLYPLSLFLSLLMISETICVLNSFVLREIGIRFVSEMLLSFYSIQSML